MAKFSDVVMGIVNSDAFQMRRVPKDGEGSAKQQTAQLEK